MCVVSLEILALVIHKLQIFEPHHKVDAPFPKNHVHRLSKKEVEGFAVPEELLLLEGANNLLKHKNSVAFVMLPPSQQETAMPEI